MKKENLKEKENLENKKNYNENFLVNLDEYIIDVILEYFLTLFQNNSLHNSYLQKNFNENFKKKYYFSILKKIIKILFSKFNEITNFSKIIFPKILSKMNIENHNNWYWICKLLKYLISSSIVYQLNKNDLLLYNIKIFQKIFQNIQQLSSLGFLNSIIFIIISFLENENIIISNIFLGINLLKKLTIPSYIMITLIIYQIQNNSFHWILSNFIKDALVRKNNLLFVFEIGDCNYLCPLFDPIISLESDIIPVIYLLFLYNI